MSGTPLRSLEPNNLVIYLTLLALHWIWILHGSAPYTLSGTARLREYRIPVTGPTGVPNGLPTAYWPVATASYRYPRAVLAPLAACYYQGPR